MVAYLGHPGSLIRVHDPADQSKDTSRPARYLSTIGGATFAQVGPRTKRSWDVRLPRISSPAEVATWQAFVEGEFGYGPWWFVPELAATTNVMSPRGSLLETSVDQAGASSNGGPLTLPDSSRAGRSWLVEDDRTVFLPWVSGLEYVPVVPGLPVTGSVFVSGPAGTSLQMRFYSDEGPATRTVSAPSSGGGVQRLSVSTVAQEGEASVLLLVRNSSSSFHVARPAITWTDGVRPWSVGAGAPKVHVASYSEDVTLAVPSREMVGVSLTVQEVG